MGILVTKEEKETQKFQRQEFLAAQKLRDEKVRTDYVNSLKPTSQEIIDERAVKAELKRATLPNLSDREIQVRMLNATKSTNGWIIFIGVVTLISVIGAVITVVNLYI